MVRLCSPHVLRNLIVVAAVGLVGCQSNSRVAAGPPASPPTGKVGAPAGTAAATQTAFASPSGAGSPAVCAIALVDGPPQKPSKGADFGGAAVKNVGKGLGRSLISGIGSSVAGPLGGAIAAGVAGDAIRSEQDLKGVWTATDAKPGCGCQLDIAANTNLMGKTANAGGVSPRSCGHPLLAQSARWTLGHSFTGYDAPFQILAEDGRTVLATLNRDGVNYFSGRLGDGTPLTVWRD